MGHSSRQPGVAQLLDEYLVLAVAAGDRSAAEQLARRWRPRLLRTARRLVDPQMAEDVVHDAWVSIARSLGRLRDPALFPGLAFGILRRRCADAHRRGYRDRDHFTALTDEAGANPATGEARSALDQAFAALPEAQRLTAILFYGEGLTLAQIASATDVPLGTAKSRLFHARKQLQHHLKGDLP